MDEELQLIMQMKLRYVIMSKLLIEGALEIYYTTRQFKD